MLVYQLSFVNASGKKTSMEFSSDDARATFMDQNQNMMSHVSLGVYPLNYGEIDKIVEGIVSTKTASRKKAASRMTIEELVDSVVRR